MKGKVLPYNKIKELRKAAAEGNEKAKAIIDKYMDNGDMDEIESMISAYYGNPTPEAPIKTIEPDDDEPSDEDAVGIEDDEFEWTSSDGIRKAAPEKKVELDKKEEVEKPSPEKPAPETKEIDVDEIGEKVAEKPDDIGEDVANEPENVVVPAPEKSYDFSSLESEFDGLVDEDEDFKPMAFKDFLSDKKKNQRRERKNADYFKAFGQDERDAFGNGKKEAYSHRFDGHRKDLERGYRDNGKAIDEYSRIITGLPMEDGDINVDSASSAYGEFTDDENVMSSFGRIWDEEDTKSIIDSLTALAMKYGKKNVLSMLNSLRQDNDAWHAFGNGKIEDAVGNYGKSIDKLLK